MNRNKMNRYCPAISRSNPFSTRRVRPGAVEYVFPKGDSAQRMIDRLQAAGWRGEIVGPHGSGKSALLATLIPAIRRAGKNPLLVELHDGQRRLPVAFERLPLECRRSVLIVDGYEQLGRWSRFRLVRRCRRDRIGLLITSHRPMGFPELHRTKPTAEIARQIVAKLLAGEQFEGASLEEPAFEDIQKAFARHGGDMRETFFDLYDLYERQSHGAKLPLSRDAFTAQQELRPTIRGQRQ